VTIQQIVARRLTRGGRTRSLNSTVNPLQRSQKNAGLFVRFGLKGNANLGRRSCPVRLKSQTISGARRLARAAFGSSVK
jgi:hypothetical protein